MRLLIAAFFALVVATVAILPAQAQQPQPALPVAIKNKADAIINSSIAKMAGCQETYKASRGRYMQVLWSHTAAPRNGDLALADKLTSKPTHQTEDANVFFSCAGITSSLPARVRVDIYDGPQGHGFSITLEVDSNLAKFQRTVNVGAEIYRERDWVEVVEIVR